MARREAGREVRTGRMFDPGVMFISFVTIKILCFYKKGKEGMGFAGRRHLLFMR
jgi:hypothetical protein